jgi:hypothetical protein
MNIERLQMEGLEIEILANRRICLDSGLRTAQFPTLTPHRARGITLYLGR